MITYEYVYGCLISDERMASYKTAFEHIVWSCLAFVLSYMKKEDELNTVPNLTIVKLNKSFAFQHLEFVAGLKQNTIFGQHR